MCLMNDPVSAGSPPMAVPPRKKSASPPESAKNRASAANARDFRPPDARGGRVADVGFLRRIPGPALGARRRPGPGTVRPLHPPARRPRPAPHRHRAAAQGGSRRRRPVGVQEPLCPLRRRGPGRRQLEQPVGPAHADHGAEVCRAGRLPLGRAPRRRRGPPALQPLRPPAHRSRTPAHRRGVAPRGGRRGHRPVGT